MEGIVNINKPAGWTSQDVCAKLRSRLHTKKIGHTGTLDPMATGVLPVCIGKATRIIEYYDKDRKTYRAVMKLGITTDTLDITGNVLSQIPVRISDPVIPGERIGSGDLTEVSIAQIKAAFAAYTGRVSQIPPKYSALKINGKRAYDLARAGEDFEIRAREVEIFKNDILSIDTERGVIEFEVSCSKGTYIRTICDDIGRALGCGAVMTALERTASGVFRIEDAAGIEELCSMSDEELTGSIIPVCGASSMTVDDTLTELGALMLDDNRVSAFINGNSCYMTQCRIAERSRFDGIYKVYGKLSGKHDNTAAARSGSSMQAGVGRVDTFIGIGRIEGRSIRPVKILV